MDNIKRYRLVFLSPLNTLRKSTSCFDAWFFSDEPFLEYGGIITLG